MARSHGFQVGIEAKIEYHLALEIIGAKYESWRRTALNWLQSGWEEDAIEKRLQSEFNIDWAWADSIATEAKQCLDQLETAKELNIARIKEQIKKKIKKTKETLKSLEKQLASAIKNGFSTQQAHTKFANTLLGLKSKISKIASLKKELLSLEKQEHLHIVLVLANSSTPNTTSKKMGTNLINNGKPTGARNAPVGFIVWESLNWVAGQ